MIEFSKIVLVMFLWAICFPLIVAGFAYAPHLTFAALRAFIAGAALVAVGLLLGRRWPRGLRVWITLVFVGLGATSLAFLGMFNASEFVSPGIATVIANTQPLLAAVLASLFLGERLDLRGKFGLVLGFSGIVVIVLPQLSTVNGDSYLAGVGYILLAAFGISVSNVLIRRVAPQVDALMAMGSQLLIGGVPLAVGALVLEDPQPRQCLQLPGSGIRAVTRGVVLQRTYRGVRGHRHRVVAGGNCPGEPERGPQKRAVAAVGPACVRKDRNAAGYA